MAVDEKGGVEGALQRMAQELGLRIIALVVGDTAFPIQVPAAPAAVFLSGRDPDLFQRLDAEESLDDPASAPLWIAQARAAVELGVQHRQANRLAEAYEYQRLGLYVATRTQDIGGVVALAGNVWTIREQVRDMFERASGPWQAAEGEEPEVMETSRADLEWANETIRTDAQQLLSRMRALAHNRGATANPELLQALLRVAWMADEDSERRATHSDLIDAPAAEEGQTPSSVELDDIATSGVNDTPDTIPAAAQIDERNRLIAEGVAIYRSGRATEAADVLGRCLSLFDDDERTSPEWADFCGNYGSALAEAGQLKRAEWMLNSALLVYGANGLREDLARTYFNLGNVRRYMNHRQGASDNYGEALRLYRELGDARGEATTLLALVTHYLSMGVVDVARERLEELDALDPPLTHDPEIRWSWLFQRANLALRENEPAQAVEHLEEALRCAETTGDESYVGETRNALLHARAQAGEPPTEEELERSVDYATRQGGRQQLGYLFQAARSWADSGDFVRARPLFERCLDLVDRTRGDLDGPERYHLMERMALIAQDYTARLVAHGETPAALAASERGQGRALLDLMFRHQIKQQGDRTVRAALSGRVVLDAPGVKDIHRFVVDSGVHVLKILETRQGTLGFFAAPDGTIEAWDATAAAQPRRAALDLLLWQQAEIADGAAPVAELRASTPAEAGPWEDVRSALARVYAALVPDGVRRRLELSEGRLLVVPHVAWFHVPWTEVGAADGEPLGARFEIAVAPSIGVFMQGSPSRDAEPWAGLDSFPLRAAAFGGIGERTVAVPLLPGTDAETETRFRELEWTEAEARRVAELLDGGSVVGGNAHPRAFRLALQGAGVVHVASHGYWNPLIGDLSFVLLAPGGSDDRGLLYGGQLHEVTTRAELVALSGCQTGLGSSHPDSYISLAASFLIAGARCVLVSLWPIGDQATRAFVDEFYGRLARGASPAAALKGAQDEFRDLLDPWDWAGFSLLGYPFHSLEPDPDAASVGGPAFCGGDVTWATDEPGAALPLDILADEVMTPDEAWLVQDGEIVRIRKR